jgi:hypothetical protein
MLLCMVVSQLHILVFLRNFKLSLHLYRGLKLFNIDFNLAIAPYHHFDTSFLSLCLASFSIFLLLSMLSALPALSKMHESI